MKSDLRVWSVIVTIFGDLAQNETDQISGGLLSRLTAAMGIRPEAMRVALHRLRKDGWITSIRQGRKSSYRLTPRAFAESQAVRSRIYSDDSPREWLLLLAPASTPDIACAIKVASGVFLCQSDQIRDARDVMALSGGGETVPDWLKDIVSTAELAEKYQKLCQCLEQIETLIHPALSELQTAALRILIVHNWRRIVLRYPILPAQFYTDNWPGSLGQHQVSRLLARLERPSIGELEKE